MTTKKGVRRIRTAIEMYPIVAQFAESGQDYATFCAGRDLKPSTLYYWKRKYQEQQQLVTATPTLCSPTAAFSEIIPSSPTTLSLSDSPLTIHYANGNRIELAAGGSLTFIQQLLQLTTPCLL